MLLFILGVIFLIVSIVAVAKFNHSNVQKNVFIGGIITGVVLVGLGFSAFTPAEDNDKLLDEMLSSEKAAHNSDVSESDVHYEPEVQTSESQKDSSSFDSDYQIESFLKENTMYKDITVSGTYVAKPFGAVITVNVSDNDDKRQVVSKILLAFYEHAEDKLDDFKSLSVLVDDGKKRLKTEYLVSTIMGNAKVYRPSQIESLAKSWEMVPSPNK